MLSLDSQLSAYRRAPIICTVKSTYGAELLALVPHLLPYRPALGSQEVPQVDGVDGGAGLLVQRGVLTNPVEDLPVQLPVLIQEGLQVHTGRGSESRPGMQRAGQFTDKYPVLF